MLVDWLKIKNSELNMRIALQLVSFDSVEQRENQKHFVLVLAQFKNALRQHREESTDRIVRNIGDVILRFVKFKRRFRFDFAQIHFRSFSSTVRKANSLREPVPNLSKINLKH